MAINRRLAICIIVVVVLAVAGTFLLMAWLGSLQVGITPHTDIGITGVQFDKDYLNITVKNICVKPKIIKEVTVSNVIAGEGVYKGHSVIAETYTPHTIAVHEPVSVDEEISFRISFKRTSGCPYQIELETADTKDWRPATIHFARAP